MNLWLHNLDYKIFLYGAVSGFAYALILSLEWTALYIDPKQLGHYKRKSSKQF